MTTQQNGMTEAEATEWVYAQDESEELDSNQLEAAFAALHNRPADDDDRQAGLWSMCCSMTPNCGTRPDPVVVVCRDAEGREISRQQCHDEDEANRLMVARNRPATGQTLSFHRWAIETETEANDRVRRNDPAYVDPDGNPHYS